MPLFRTCARPGCADYASDQGRFCLGHLYIGAAARREQEIARNTRPDRIAAQRVYGDSRWDPCRQAAFERDGHRCVMCGTEDRLQGHHIFGITGTEDDFDSELVLTLCADCHPLAERRRRNGYASR